MKKITSILLLFVFTLSLLTSCGISNNDTTNEGNKSKIRIGTLSGPTGMGIAKMISDNGFDSDKYSFTVFGDPVSAQDAFIAGDLDAICFPTNNAAKLYAKTNGQLYVTAINCLGSLYVISSKNVTINSIQDLEGKTIYASVPNSTTGAIIEYILKENNINANVSFALGGEELTSHDLLATRIGEGKIDIAILPEPKATATILANPTLGLSIDLNLSAEWEKVSESTEPLTMGCIIFSKKFVDNNKNSVDAFLTEYNASISFINDKANLESAAEMIVSAGILPKVPLAKKALNNLYGSIVYIEGSAMKNALKSFYTVINENQPDDNFYYER